MAKEKKKNPNIIYGFVAIVAIFAVFALILMNMYLANTSAPERSDLTAKAGAVYSSIGGSSGGDTIECYDDSGCPQYAVESFCLGDEHCTGSIYVECINPGTPDSYCFEHDQVTLCEHCPYGCEDGMCVEEPDNIDFQTEYVFETDVGVSGTEFCLERGYDGCVMTIEKSKMTFYETTDGTCDNIQYIDKETDTEPCDSTLIKDPAICREPGASSNYAEPYYGDSAIERKSYEVICYIEPTILTYGEIFGELDNCVARYQLYPTASCDVTCEEYGRECSMVLDATQNPHFDEELLEEDCKDYGGSGVRLCICC
ncbi:MAG: hypothetical protein ABIE94_07410 [archaeon]